MPDRNGKIFYTSITSLSHISKYERYIVENGFNKYGSALIPLPVPKLITFYNGTREQPDEQILLFQQVQLDPSRTCVYWNEDIDLPSDVLYEYGVEV